MSANGDKGKRFERAVADVLRGHGHPYAERALYNGAHTDRGDIAGVPGFYFDAKDRVEYQLATWMDEVAGQARHLDLVPVLVVKRRRLDADHAYAILELATFAELIANA